eukprot:scaffold172089_cov17-Tisochrysis_lutea.AAC.1
MADVEHRRRLSGKPPSKYYGKWPFQRLLGMQEAASVLFSLANLCAHVYGLSYLLGKFSLLSSGSAPSAPEDQKSHDVAAPPAPSPPNPSRGRYPYKWLWLVYAGLHLNAWLWSAAGMISHGLCVWHGLSSSVACQDQGKKGSVHFMYYMPSRHPLVPLRSGLQKQ